MAATGATLSANNMDVKLVKGDRVWEIAVSGDGDGVTTTTTWGKHGGKLGKAAKLHTAGKAGRTALQQATQEAEAAAKRKRRDGYSAPDETGGRGDSVAPRPMLAVDWHRRSAAPAGPLIAQHKLDGIRCVCDTETGLLFTRSGAEIHGLAHISAALQLAVQAHPPPCRWLDGEIYRHGAGFQEIVSAARRTVNPDAARAAAMELHLFDCIADDSCADRLRALHQWYDVTSALVPAGELDAIRVVHTEALPTCDDAGALQEAVRATMLRFIAQGYEGAMLRVADAKYEIGKRSAALLKAKEMRQAEYEVVCIVERDRQRGVAASVMCRTAEGKTFKATPEMTERLKRELWQQRHQYDDGDWRASVRFQELTAGGVPRFPVLVGMRRSGD